jgi:transposase
LEKIPEDNLVYLDEAGTNLGMTRSHARSLEGERAFFKRPANRGGNISLVGAIRLGENPVLYPFDGAVDGERFLWFLEHHLMPTLRAGDVVIMDNCRIHHIADVKTLLSSVGASPLFMPPYSPELNPIEEAWSLIKATFKSLEARTISAYVDALEFARQSLTREKIRAFVDHAFSFLQKSKTTANQASEITLRV